jgi:serine/threonine protein phosphatase 1
VVVFAIGDVHGRVDLLERATAAIEAQAAEAAGANRTILIFLGDYIDRGPSSREVIEHLMALKARAPFELTFLRGNHEQILIDLIGGGEDSARWLDHGGRETLMSYGARLPARGVTSVKSLREIARDCVPAEHLEFLTSTEFFRKVGDYIFVHGGLRPDRLVEEQSDADMLWYRMLTDERPLWRETVVHGHQPNPRPIEGRHHIGIDTGAWETGALTVLRVEAEERAFMKATVEPTGALTAWSDTATNYHLAALPRSDDEPRSVPAGPRPDSWWRLLFSRRAG